MTSSHKDTHLYTQTCMYTPHRRRDTCIQIDTDIHMYKHACTHTCTRTHTCIYIRTHTDADTDTQIHRHTHAHTHTQTDTQKHTGTYTHIHMQRNIHTDIQTDTTLVVNFWRESIRNSWYCIVLCIFKIIFWNMYHERASFYLPNISSKHICMYVGEPTYILHIHTYRQTDRWMDGQTYLGKEYSAIQYLAMYSSCDPSWYQMLVSSI